MKITHAPELEPGQSFIVDDFHPEDALGVAQLFLSTYGSSYPVDTYYDPEWLVAANARGEVNSVVARAPSGDILAHGALYRSSPPNPRLLEYGQLIVRMNYRTTFAAFKIHKYLHDTVLPRLAPDGVFGEGVTNRLESQKVTRVTRYHPMAMELDLMPSEAYEAEQSASGRVSCVTCFRPWKDAPQTLHVPDRFRDILSFILEGTGLERHLAMGQPPPPDTLTHMEGRTFAAAGVTRVNVFQPGADFPQRMAAWTQEAAVPVNQVYLCLQPPEAAWAAEELERQGFVLGGLMPWWFGPDALLMQKVTRDIDYEAIQLFDPKAKELLERLRGLMP